MAYELHKSSVRKGLKPRREPYWGPPIARGQYIGLRKIDAATATWIARRRNDDGGQNYHSLGFCTDAFDWDQARAAAETWFKLKDSDIKDDVVTVSDACRRYVDERRTSKSEDCAHDAEKRFERTVYENPLGERALAKLRTAHIKSWRDGLHLRPATMNRTLTALKAALNLAVAERNVIASQSQEWAEVKPLKVTRKPRVYLDLQQRRALLAAATGAIRDLIEGALTTGARPGELVRAHRRQYDGRTQSMTFIGKTGERTVPLGPSAVTLFDRLAKSKLPAALLFVRDDGKPWQHSDWDELVRAAATKAELPAGVTLYSCRHSWITTALTSGMTTLDVARLTGTSIQMIELTYGHLVVSAARERLAKVTLL